MRRVLIVVTLTTLTIALLISACSPAPAPTPTGTAAPQVAATLPCSDTTVSLLQPATASPTPAPAAPTPTPGGAPPAPTATPRPAPQVDRVGFPEGYRENYKLFFVFDRVDTRSIQFMCANDKAASVKPGEHFPYGSVLVFETWRPKQEGGQPVKDDRGRLIREALNTIFVMRKEQGFGEAYGPLRNGEWEYVAYRPDKTIQTPPQNTANCASCHLAGVGAGTTGGAGQDFVFRTNLFFDKEKYAQSSVPGPNEAQMSRMAFFPNNLSIKAGTTMKWTNDAVDLTDHTVTANDKSFDSGVLKPGATFSRTFNTAGTFTYTCTLHPDQMRATIRVTE